MQRQVGPSRVSSYAQVSILLAVGLVAMTVLALWLAGEADRATDEVKVLRMRVWNANAVLSGCIWVDGQWKRDRDVDAGSHIVWTGTRWLYRSSLDAPHGVSPE